MGTRTSPGAIQFLKKSFGAALTLGGLLILVFFCLRLAPGGPFDQDRRFPPDIELAIRARYGLNQPVYLQLADWISDILHGDLGESFSFIGRPVKQIIGESLPVSLELGLIALGLALAAGVPLGAWSAARRDSWIDRVSQLVTAVGISLPTYLLASLLVIVFALKLRWLPPALWDESGAWILPALTLAFRPFALITQLVRTSMIEALRADYVRSARAKGLSELKVIYRHALRNSLIPVITWLGPLAANLLTGSFLVETVFQIPGLGQHFVNAMLNRDYPLVMGTTLTYGVGLLAANLGVDFLYGFADPRMRLLKGAS